MLFVQPNKRHPCDPFTFGRVRFALKKEDGSFAVPALTSKWKVLQQVAAKLPTHEARLRRLADEARQREEYERRLRETAAGRAALGPGAAKKEDKKGKAATAKKPGKR